MDYEILGKKISCIIRTDFIEFVAAKFKLNLLFVKFLKNFCSLHCVYKPVHWPSGQCSWMVRETGVQSQIETYQRLKKWYLISFCLTLSIIRYVSRVRWSNPGEGVAHSPTLWCSSYRKGSLLVALDYSRKLYLLLYCVSKHKIYMVFRENAQTCLHKIYIVCSISNNTLPWHPND